MYNIPRKLYFHEMEDLVFNLHIYSNKKDNKQKSTLSTVFDLFQKSMEPESADTLSEYERTLSLNETNRNARIINKPETVKNVEERFFSVLQHEASKLVPVYDKNNVYNDGSIVKKEGKYYMLLDSERQYTNNLVELKDYDKSKDLLTIPSDIIWNLRKCILSKVIHEYSKLPLNNMAPKQLNTEQRLAYEVIRIYVKDFERINASSIYEEMKKDVDKMKSNVEYKFFYPNEFQYNFVVDDTDKRYWYPYDKWGKVEDEIILKMENILKNQKEANHDIYICKVKPNNSDEVFKFWNKREMLWEVVMEQLLKPIEKLKFIESEMKQKLDKISTSFEQQTKDDDIIQFLNMCIDFLLWENKSNIPAFYPDEDKMKNIVRDIYNKKHEIIEEGDYIEWEKRTNLLFIRTCLLYNFYVGNKWIKENNDFQKLKNIDFSVKDKNKILQIFSQEEEVWKFYAPNSLLSVNTDTTKYKKSVIHLMKTKIDEKRFISICNKLRDEYISFIKSHLPEFKIYKDDKYGIMSFARLIESKSDENFNKHTLHVSAFASKVESDEDELYEFQWFLLGFDDVEHVSNWLSGTKNIVTQTMLKVPYLDTHERILYAKDREKLKNIYKKHGEYLNEELRKKMKDNKEVYSDDKEKEE